MKKSRPYLFIASLLLVLASCGKIKEPDFRGVENIRTDHVGLDETSFTMEMLYYNPNKYGVRLKSAEGDAWIDSKFLGHFIVDTLISIPAKADFRLPVKIAVDTKDIFRNSLKALFAGEVTIKINGKARLGKAGIFINYPLDYEVKQPINELWK